MMHEPNAGCGCEEYEALERRQLLSAAWRMGALAMASVPAWFPKMAFATDGGSSSARDLLVVVFLRGGADGLSFCVPFGDPYYASSRSNLAVPPPDSAAPLRAINLDGFFGLPPGLALLKPIYDAGHLAVVHAVGNPFGVRSHFLDQDQVELATPVIGGNPTGWLARHLLSTPGSVGSHVRGLSAGFSLAHSMIGAPSSVAMSSDGVFGLSGWGTTAAERRAFLASVYSGAGEPLANHAANILSAMDSLNMNPVVAYPGSGPILFDTGISSDTAGFLDSALPRSGQPDPTGPSYPNDGWGQALRTIAQFAKADIGLEAASIDLNNWDTHADQGTLNGALNSLMSHLAEGLAAFYDDMDSRMNSTTVVVMSEFGRRVASNDSGGCDHGRGGVMLVIGGNVNGGRVVTQWPGLHPDQLLDHLDLAITTDYRDVLGEILVRRAGDTSLPTVFPGYTPVFRGIVQ